MTFTGHFHPLLVHFPIALVLTAAAAEAIASVTGIKEWHVVAVANTRAGAVFAAAAAATGWLLASSTVVDSAASLEWHRWIGAAAAIATLVAALATGWIYRVALFGAAALVAVTGHLGGVLVWGASFLRL
ncbi:MAG TPA: DUF2231 domain-containing protein [Vicinamibacterales bacterium]|nr:DUF2231 domain-containing protein [Vicinamibacterales bacterium]